MPELNFLKTLNGQEIRGPQLLIPKIFEDERGFFYESWNKKEFEKLTDTKNIIFVQDNHSKSSFGILRGLHYQLPPFGQGKLVRCSYGEIFDVAVDLRKSSITFGKWVGIKLNAENKFQLWIPEGFAHGFLTLSNFAEVQYKTTNYWNPKYERSINWNDNNLNIEWPREEFGINIISANSKDSAAPCLNDANSKGDIFN